jgi:hypothetical protein
MNPPAPLHPSEAEEPLVYGPAPLGPRVATAEASAEDAHTLLVRFDTGERRTFDLRPYLDLGVFRSLQDPDAARDIRVIGGGSGVEWSSGPDLSADTLYLRGEPS